MTALPVRRWAERFGSGEIEVVGHRAGEQVRTRVVLTDDRASLDALGRELHALDAPAVLARLVAEGGLVVRLVPGWLVAELPAGGTVTLSVATEGPAGAAALCEPLRVVFADGPLRLRVAGLPEVTLRGLTLAPDGEVELTPAHGAPGRRWRWTASAISAVLRRKPKIAVWLRRAP